METCVARLEGATKVYPAAWPRHGPISAVVEVDLTLGPGEIVGLIGPNRAGKSTLAKLLLSLCRPSSGRVERFGRPSSDRRTLARVGYVHEEAAFPAHLTATALLDEYGALSGVPARLRKDRIPALLAQVGLADRASEPISRFSKGMGRRLAMAQALVNEPDLLILDEPFSGMDVEARHLAEGLLRDRRRRGCGVLLISHDLDEVERLSDRVVAMSQGRIAREVVATTAEKSGEGRWIRPLAEALVSMCCVAEAAR